MKKEHRELIGKLKAEGIEVTRTWIRQSGHTTIEIRTPKGKHREYVSTTASDHRACKKILARLRRISRGQLGTAPSVRRRKI